MDDCTKPACVPLSTQMGRERKPTLRQLAVMRFLARAHPIPWMPSELDQFDSCYPEIITATKHVPAIRAIIRKGWATSYPKLGKYACVMTGEGLSAFKAATASERPPSGRPLPATRTTLAYR